MKIWVNKDNKGFGWYAYAKPNYKIKEAKASFSVKFAKCEAPVTNSAQIEFNDGDFTFDTDAWQKDGKLEKKFVLTIFNYHIASENTYSNIAKENAKPRFEENKTEQVAMNMFGKSKVETENIINPDELPFF